MFYDTQLFKTKLLPVKINDCLCLTLSLVLRRAKYILHQAHICLVRPRYMSLMTAITHI